MDELSIRNPDRQRLREVDNGGLSKLLGDIERHRYKLADIEQRVMEELDEREGA